MRKHFHLAAAILLGLVGGGFLIAGQLIGGALLLAGAFVALLHWKAVKSGIIE